MNSSLGNKQVMAKNIQYYMDLHGKTRNEMCEALGIKYTTFTDWVNGNSYPRIDKIELIANYFKISKSDLVEDHSRTESTFPVTESEQTMLTKYRSLDDYGVEMVDFTLEKQYERCEAEKTARISRFPEPDYLTPVAAHERTDIEVTQEMIDHDNDIMDDENF